MTMEMSRTRLCSKMWLGTKVSVQWGAKLGILECESVDISFLPLNTFQWLGPENVKIGQKLARMWTQTLTPGHIWASAKKWPQTVFAAKK